MIDRMFYISVTKRFWMLDELEQQWLEGGFIHGIGALRNQGVRGPLKGGLTGTKLAEKRPREKEGPQAVDQARAGVVGLP